MITQIVWRTLPINCVTLQRESLDNQEKLHFIGHIYVCLFIAPYAYCFLCWRGQRRTLLVLTIYWSAGERKGLNSSLLCAMTEKLNDFHKCFFFMFDPMGPIHECI